MAGPAALLQDGRMELAVRFGSHGPPAVGCAYASQQALSGIFLLVMTTEVAANSVRPTGLGGWTECSPA